MRFLAFFSSWDGSNGLMLHIMKVLNSLRDLVIVSLMFCMSDCLAVYLMSVLLSFTDVTPNTYTASAFTAATLLLLLSTESQIPKQ